MGIESVKSNSIDLMLLDESFQEREILESFSKTKDDSNAFFELKFLASLEHIFDWFDGFGRADFFMELGVDDFYCSSDTLDIGLESQKFFLIENSDVEPKFFLIDLFDDFGYLH